MKSLVTFFLLFVLFQGHSFAADSSRSKPNIVFIFADDWGWGDLSCHGHPRMHKPIVDNTEALGELRYW